VDLTLASQWLGHAQLEKTQVYAHADTEHKRRAIQRRPRKEIRFALCFAGTLCCHRWRNAKAVEWSSVAKKNIIEIFGFVTTVGAPPPAAGIYNRNIF